MGYKYDIQKLVPGNVQNETRREKRTTRKNWNGKHLRRKVFPNCDWYDIISEEAMRY